MNNINQRLAKNYGCVNVIANVGRSVLHTNRCSTTHIVVFGQYPQNMCYIPIH